MWAGKTEFVFLDVETTGLSPALGDRIVEIGLLTCVGPRETARLSQLVNPMRMIPPAARRIHGISDAQVACSPTFNNLAQDVARALDGRWVVGHNIRFDLGFLAMELACAGVSARPAGCLDTRVLADTQWLLRNYRLDTVAAHVGANGSGAHRALPDAQRTRAVFRRLVSELGGWSRVRIEDLVALHPSPIGWPEDGRKTLPAHLYNALTNGGEVAIRYLNGSGRHSRRSIRPLASFSIGRRIYLRAHCALAGEVRTFRLDRIVGE